MNLNLILSLVALCVLASGQTTGDRSSVYKSPDRKLRAVVITGATGESQIDIQASPGRVLLRRDERSNDGSHGHGIVQAAWTSDSQFFIASTSASGGHQPWARSLWVYSRSKNRVFELWKFGITATTDFKLKPPDIVLTTALGCDSDNNPRPIAFRLYQLVSTGRITAAPCPNQ